ncbi:MAG: hypothetical protein EOP06_01715 [Proteobacteria bacterium]|nr:MAG: hypothetical protein EOP06_01715 [Pseudomonadota bacterium]
MIRAFRILFLSLIFLASLYSLRAHAADEHHAGPYIGVGFQRVDASVRQPAVHAKLAGSGVSFEAGIDLPFTRQFGISIAGQFSEKELKNKTLSDEYLDYTKLTSTGGRAHVFLKGVLAGGSYWRTKVDIRTVSSLDGASRAALNGKGSSIFLGYAFALNSNLRTQVEIERSRFLSPAFRYEDYSIGLKLQILLGSLF